MRSDFNCDRRVEMDFLEIDGAVISQIPGDEEIDMDLIDLIVHNTRNTWQAGRGEGEKRRDTIQGKKAELVFERYVAEHTGHKYLSYDDFREDGFRKHAPFDGLLIGRDTDAAAERECINAINREIAYGSEVGTISPDLRKKLEDRKIFTLEIKSSSLKKRDYEGVDNAVRRTRDACRQIVHNLERWDFFVYPHYLRTSGSVADFYDYTEYVRLHEKGFPQGNERFLRQLMKEEYDHASDLYTRFYFDYAKGHIYLPGYILKEDFFRNPRIMHMPGLKSGMALYYMYGMRGRTAFSRIDTDGRIWAYDREVAYERLFAGREYRCGICKDRLRICKSMRNRGFFYRCYTCERNFSLESVLEDL